MAPYKDEHILIIEPGSHTTLAQLGLPESYHPSKWRFPTRMFPGAKEGDWEPHKIRARTHTEGKSLFDENDSTSTQEINMIEDPASGRTLQVTTTYEDDPLSVEDAVYPIKEGRIENWSCFFALLTHIYNTLSPPFHTPILLIAQPCWSARDHEFITQFFFESFKMPAFALMDSAHAVMYAYGVDTATIIDIGHEKCEVTAIAGSCTNHTGRAIAVPNCGGQAMTKRLHQLLKGHGFTADMCEQLKHNSLCEILPPGSALPKVTLNGEVGNPAAAASTGAMESGPDARDLDGLRPGQLPRGPGFDTMVGQDGDNDDENDNEGILDVAAIVAQSNAAEILAKREKEKAEKAAAKKGALGEAPKAIKLKNSERAKIVFAYEEYVPFDELPADYNGQPESRKRKREVEVGIERFMVDTPEPGFAEGIIDTVAAVVYNTIQSVPLNQPEDKPYRSMLWDNLIIVGNGSRVKGFKAALIATLSARYMLSPSTATMFTSELPSNFSTPLPTNGTNTPIPGQHGQMHHPAAHGVNPLLVAATQHANQQMAQQQQQHLLVPGHQSLQPHQTRRGHSQTPTSIKTVKVPDYFPEWKDPNYSGMEEAVWLGAQMAARTFFIIDQNQSNCFLMRGEYNDMGPAGIHDRFVG